MISSWIPFEEPAGGPTFYRFEEGTQYDLNVDNDGDAVADYTIAGSFKTRRAPRIVSPYNTGPINSLDDPNLNLKQNYTLQVIYKGNVEATVGPVATLYNNVGDPSTPSFLRQRHRYHGVQSSKRRNRPHFRGPDR